MDIRNSQPLLFCVILIKEYEGRKIPENVRHYIQLCEKGGFYDYLMEQYNIPPSKRSEFKPKFFASVFFCENDPIRRYASMFMNVFPDVYKVVRRIKTPDYADLARRLQRSESDLIIGKIASRIIVELPGTFIATIHDSIVIADDAELVRKTLQIMSEEFQKVGLNPTINSEPFVVATEPWVRRRKRGRRTTAKKPMSLSRRLAG